VRLDAVDSYRAWGLTDRSVDGLSTFGDALLDAGFNVTGVKDARSIERVHFLDSLELLGLPEVAAAASLVDVGSGGGLPAAVLAIALPEARVVALESTRKKCAFISASAERVGLTNLTVVCMRAEEFARSEGRERFDVAVTRALGSLAVDAELAVPLVQVGGLFISMKGSVSEQERVRGDSALAILGAEPFVAQQVRPFPEAENRWLYWARKVAVTPAAYPRRTGIPAKRPLGG
jgi:16S rRNA (guanine527-N7)-methyltransferase